ncbi:uncharacterized protein isoform X2 [Rhodnius prolixus]|uniref:uncharacterized protein isoform X2 n=1 Tax=Rhodnius prolixus TaxID=13249 RepID=UPI003D18AAC6
MDLTNLLTEQGASAELIANSWWTVYRVNAEDAFILLTELMFQAGGWVDYKYRMYGFPSAEKFKDLKEYGPVSLHPLIMDNEDFQIVYRQFVASIAECDRCRILYDQQFFAHVGTMFEVMSCGKWDAFRLVAFITGKQLWNCLEKEFIQRKYIPSQHWQLLLKEHSAPFLSRDELKPCYDFLSWSIASPVMLLDDIWHHTILCWLREKNVEKKAVAHMAVFHLFRKKIDLLKQKKLMKYIKPDFMYSLSVKSNMAEISLRTLLVAVRYMDIEMNQAEIECMIAQLYEPVDTSIALLAGKLFSTSNIVSFADDAPGHIVRLLEINAESYIGSEDLLVDSVYIHIYKFLNWADWLQVESDSPRDSAENVLTLLCAYVRKATTNYTPKMRMKKVVEALGKKNEIYDVRREFTRVFAAAWLEIASHNKVRISAPHKLAKLVQYFDGSIEPKIMKEIAYILCGLHCCTSESVVSDECCKSLEHLFNLVSENNNCEDKEFNDAVKLLVQSLARISQQDFIMMLTTYPAFMSHSELALPHNTLIMKKMLSVCQWLTFDDTELWDFAMEKLISVYVLPLTQNLVQTLLTLLFQMVMKSANQLLGVQNEFTQNTNDALKKIWRISMNNCVNKFVLRALHYKIEARHFLSRRYNSSLRSTIFYTLLDLLEYSLANFQYHNQFLSQLTSFDSDEIIALLSYALEFMEYTQCNKHFHSDANIRCCCFAITRICNLISRGFLDIQNCLSPFIKLIGKNIVHDEIIIRTLYDYSCLFPHKWENVSITIFNSLISLLDDTLIKYITPDSANEEYENALLWTPVQNLIEMLSEYRFKKPVVRTACLKLHIHIINCALGPSGHPSILRLLYAFKHLLAQYIFNSIIRAKQKQRI